MRMSISYQYNNKRQQSSGQADFETKGSIQSNEPCKVTFRMIPLIALRTMPSDWFTAQGTGLNTDGLIFHYKNDIAIGNLLELKMILPNITSTIHSIGKVVHTIKPHNSSLFCITVKFTRISEHDKKRIQGVRKHVTIKI